MATGKKLIDVGNGKNDQPVAAVLNNNKIYVAGVADGKLSLIALDAATGALDINFDVDGKFVSTQDTTSYTSYKAFVNGSNIAVFAWSGSSIDMFEFKIGSSASLSAPKNISITGNVKDVKQSGNDFIVVAEAEVIKLDNTGSNPLSISSLTGVLDAFVDGTDLIVASTNSGNTLLQSFDGSGAAKSSFYSSSGTAPDSNSFTISGTSFSEAKIQKNGNKFLIAGTDGVNLKMIEVENKSDNGNPPSIKTESVSSNLSSSTAKIKDFISDSNNGFLINTDDAVYRLNTSNQLLTSFDVDGKWQPAVGETFISAIANLGKTIVLTQKPEGSNQNTQVISLKNDGSLDTAFGDVLNTPTDGPDSLTGTIGKDSIEGLAGNDTLDGGKGVDTLVGGAGDDIYYVDVPNDVVQEKDGEGTDKVVVELARTGFYTLPAFVEDGEIKDGVRKVTVNLVGNELKNTLTGNSMANTLTGLAGDDTLDGGKGADRLIGGAGDDVYHVDHRNDVIVELAGEGTDTVVINTAYYKLPNFVEKAEVHSSFTSAVTIVGNDENNMITGGVGNDSLSGGKGNDTFVGSDGVDTIDGGEGQDTIQLTGGFSDYTFEQTGNKQISVFDTSHNPILIAKNVESFVFATNTTKTLKELIEEHNTATAFDDILDISKLPLSSSGSTTVDGLAGNDSITGTSDADTLIGGAGIDTLVGGGGDDTYEVDTPKDVVTERDNEGTDLVEVKFLKSGLYVLPADVENAEVTNTNNITVNLQGNDIDNLLTGHAGNNMLSGGKGDDTLSGGVGADRLFGDDGDDSLDGGLGNDSLVGGEGNDTLLGDAGNDTLDGGMGTDSLTGDDGKDVFMFSFLDDTVKTTITDFKSGEDKIHLAKIDADSTKPNDQAFVFIGSKAFTGTEDAKKPGELRFESNKLEGDMDGDGTADFTIIITLTGGSLTVKDFIL